MILAGNFVINEYIRKILEISSKIIIKHVRKGET